jgi:hypothetical protein
MKPTFFALDYSEPAFGNLKDVPLPLPLKTVDSYYFDSWNYTQLQQPQPALLGPQYASRLHAPETNGSANSHFLQELQIDPLSTERPLTSASLPLQVYPAVANGTIAKKTGKKKLKSEASIQGSSIKRSKLPGPIPASTTPITVHCDSAGVDWLTFTYTRASIRTIYCIRCDIANISLTMLPSDFCVANCIYLRACVPPEQYVGNRQRYETECNAIGWCLAWVNVELRGQRGLIQRAVDCWRNTNADPKMRSRRVRKILRKMNTAG